MTLGPDILHIIVVGALQCHYGQIYYILSRLDHVNDIRGKYITYYCGWITVMTLGADILHIIEVGSL